MSPRILSSDQNCGMKPIGEAWRPTSRGSLSDSEETQGVSVGFGGQKHREEGGQEPQEAGNQAEAEPASRQFLAMALFAVLSKPCEPSQLGRNISHVYNQSHHKCYFTPLPPKDVFHLSDSNCDH